MLREPLVHFLAIGGAIFALYGLNAEPETSGGGDRILVTGDDIERMTGLWEKRRQRSAHCHRRLRRDAHRRSGAGRVR
jgi:hypothetical protein